MRWDSFRRDGWSRLRFPTYIRGLLNGLVVHFVHVSTA